jgi:hypothetical protein
MAHLIPAPQQTPAPKINLTPRTMLRVFPVTPPVTVFVRASHCQVTAHYHELNQVELHASLYGGFGMRLVVEQDEAGVYVVARRRRLVGLLSRCEFTLTIPMYCHLAFNLTPGTIRLQDLNGALEIPPILDNAGATLSKSGKKVLLLESK